MIIIIIIIIKERASTQIRQKDASCILPVLFILYYYICGGWSQDFGCQQRRKRETSYPGSCCPSVRVVAARLLGRFFQSSFLLFFSVCPSIFCVCVLFPASSLVLTRSSIQTRSCKASAMRRLFPYQIRESKETEITVASITHRQWRQSTTTSCRRRTHGTLYKCIRLCGSQTATTCPISTTHAPYNWVYRI